MTSPRERLAGQQAQLLKALLAGGEAPAGFDAGRLHIEANVLRNKQSRLAAYLRPDLAETLGDRFGALFREYAASHPKTDAIRARAYADAFGTWLVERGEVPKPPGRLARWLRRGS
ncbi:hypothetical protein [Amycolatopsis regifaucium]|uniref:SCO6045-like C-terminal domain-containing protein n=1 Tax=Amycolatopsis regifaucium TaxID=546365 RepID=A0A154M7U8_9PSEU|nr:hypothetical protein [Amycolatopsis regifaucium]KZB80616.1 hypothetical protein AVL48_11600 [Amycolatopsis regifaucium]OKA03063.1 hypothetical protein ATP06_0238200 [Amycolatopsis regifaucium]SFH00861.1 hypothetical protein SAMN04489731_10238 [Amycolatopsis regifaucium]